MTLLQKILAGIAGLGMLGLALTLGLAVLGVLLIIAPFAYLYLRWRGNKLKKAFEQEMARRGETWPPEADRPRETRVIEADYVIVEESRDDRRQS